MIKKAIKRANKQLYPGHLFYAPEWLILGVNNTCNLHCKMCDVGTANMETNFAVNLVGTRPLHMPMELIRKLFDEAALKFPQTKMGYAFTEPLVYKHLEESLEYAQHKNLYTSITTNALNLKRKAQGLVETRLNDLFISLDGPSEIHNEIRGHQKSFQKAIEGIEALLEYDHRPDISVFCVITEWNIGHLKEFANYFSKYPLKQLGFMHTNFTPQNVADHHNSVYGTLYEATQSNVDEINIDQYDLDLLFDEINALKKSNFNFPITFSPEINNKAQLEVFYKHPELLFGKKCNDIHSNIMIKSDGSVIPAHGRCYNLTAGNVYDQSIQEIWNSRVLSTFRKDLKKAGGLLPACSRCCSAFG